jgi:hypothetical protein
VIEERFRLNRNEGQLMHLGKPPMALPAAGSSTPIGKAYPLGVVMRLDDLVKEKSNRGSPG